MFRWILLAVYVASATASCVCAASTFHQYRRLVRDDSDGDSVTLSVLVYGEPGIEETCLLADAAHLFAARDDIAP